MARTKVEIANMALRACGSEVQIVALEDNNRVAKAVDQYIDTAIRDVLRRHEWNEVIRRAELTEDEVVDNYTAYGYAFDLPSDCLVPLELNNLESVPRLIEAGHLYADEDEPILRYIKDAVDEVAGVMEFGDHIALAIQYRLAIIIGPIVKGTVDLSILAALYDAALNDAKGMDSEVSHSRPDIPDWWSDPL